MQRSRLVLGCALLALACSRTPSPAEGAPHASAPASPVMAAAPAPSDVAAPPADATVMASGVASKVMRAGNGGAPPGPNDCVRLAFTSWKRDGSLHATTLRDGEPATQCLRRALPGLAEAVEHMSVAEERRVWVPGKLTYRAKAGDDPAPADDLTFDVTLLEILRAPATPLDLRAPPATARKTTSGLALLVLAKGAGPRHARPNERMTVRFTGWTESGELVESTELGEPARPASVSRADVVRGVGEGLALMEIGEKARVWLPAALAYGEKPRRGAPAGNLVYDLELLAVD